MWRPVVSRPRVPMNAARRSRNAGSPSVSEYCSDRTASAPLKTSSNAARRPGTSNVSGAGRPPARLMIWGCIAVSSSSRTGEDCVSARRRESGAPTRGAGGEMAICGSWIVIGRVWSRRPPGERAGSRERRCGLLASWVRSYALRQSEPRAFRARLGPMLAYDREGPRDGLPVVLLHAGIADRRMWDPLWPGLTAERDATRLDL